ncbi:Major facilitator superfamily domain, general substrate transporter [Penicillium griseofulvum]|uniref:Major facilitator superfamily domain, general substrate transporter n=1 Tax=Penicillium patulum TaxID=5078 RepID=A0A135LSA2_PENPA|nr:Major facilitator superfamily domain, general substrate transporter [Penicillium griseofulvum]KXG51835.1 Major facilitator superfamily domain, general substrate transporter [Penicillium griseofulvum]
MSASNNIDSAWPPGTVRLEGGKKYTDISPSAEGAQVILEPKPSSDPNDPLNWPQWRKYVNFGFVSYYTMMVFGFINVATVTWGSMNIELGFSFALLNDSYAAGCGGLCIGAVILVPFALKFGRRPVYVLSTAVQCGISIWSARMHTVADLMLVNILSCIFGALAEVLVQMTVADVFFVHERGLMNTLYLWAGSVGLSLAPLAGGFVTLSQGWRWVWWWMAILFGAGFIAFFFFYEETMFCVPSIDGIPVADRSAPQPASKKHGLEPSNSNGEQNDSAQQPIQIEHVEIDYSIPKKPYSKKLALWSNSSMSFVELLKHSYQPFLIMFSIPAVLFMALEYGFMTACATVPAATLASVMTLPPYNFTSAQIGLMGLAPFIGISLATIVCGPLSDSIALRLAKRNGGVFEPEMRLWLSLIFLPLIPAGLLMFGIGLNNGSHWILPAFGLGINAFGVVPTGSTALTYLTDAYTDIIADSVVGVTFIRNLISTIFVFALVPWVDRVGLTWFFVTFGLIATIIMLGNVIFIYFGKSFRVRFAGKYRSFSAQRLGAT